MANQRDEATAQGQFYRFLDKRSVSSHLAHYAVCDSLLEIAHNLRQTSNSFVGIHHTLATRYHLISTPYHNPSISTESEGERKLRKWKASRLLGKMRENNKDYRNRADTLYHIIRKAYDEETYVNYTSEGLEVPEDELLKGYVPVPQRGTAPLPRFSEDDLIRTQNYVTIVVGLMLIYMGWYLMSRAEVLPA